MAARRVELYMQPGCGDCFAAEQFLKARGVAFTEYDIRADEKARRRLVDDLGSRVTATLVIDGEVLRGFGANRQRAEELLVQG
ncbi:glutaredoxin domain-containing protein [Limnochorda pilosa]|uniref:Glutaredoxin n=1 Tax=Limnochorda pilosa TaxID=1555112 RepID=A0A0K2SPZ8_LIMPI|nr:glutaredoxin domain-containing protein [Limnochorda pilosa]BAS29195.1 glutaredoxin [Limnochorda pilosa]